MMSTPWSAWSKLIRGRTAEDLSSLAALGAPEADRDEDSGRLTARRGDAAPGLVGPSPLQVLALARLRKRPAAALAPAPPQPVFSAPIPPPMRPDVSGFSFIKDFVHTIGMQLPESVMSSVAITISQWCLDLGVDGDALTVKIGTVCSGSELYLSALKHLSYIVKDLLGVMIKWQHCWCFELDTMKRAWIRSNWAPTHCFGDVTAIQEGKAFDYVNNRMEKIPEVDLIFAGVSCVDASRLSCHSTTRRGVIAEGTHSTGSTFKGLMTLTSLLRPRKVLIENVPQLMDKAAKPKPTKAPDASTTSEKSNFEAIVDHCHALGYSLIHHIADASQFGLPVSRPRLYMMATRGDWRGDEDDELRQAGAALQAGSVMRDIAQIVEVFLPQLTLDDFLFPEYDEIFNDWVQFGTPNNTKQSRRLKWVALHEAAWAASAFPEDKKYYQAMLEKSPFYQYLSPRAQDSLLLQLCHESFPGTPDIVSNLESSVDRVVHRNHERMHCLVPRGLYWLKHRGRMLLGVEALLLQGCDLNDLPTCRPKAWQNNFLNSLAGNAFSAPHFVSWLIGCLAVR